MTIIVLNHLWKEQGIVFVKEFPTAISDKYPVRVYYSKERDNGKCYRWFLGFQKKQVEPLCPLLESSPYWGEQHAAEEIDGEKEFWIWWETELTESKDEIPKKLNRCLKFKLMMYNECMNFLGKMPNKLIP